MVQTVEEDPPVGDRYAQSMSAHAILFQTHRLDTSVRQEFESLVRSCEPHYDVFFLYDNSRRDFPRQDFRNYRHVLYAVEDIEQDYPLRDSRGQARVVPGNGHIPILQFMHNRGYDHCWRVEYDVRFTGEWKSFFDAFADTDSDLLGTTLHTRGELPEWMWFDEFKSPSGDLGDAATLRSFLPIFRLSRRGARATREAAKNGWEGHLEVLLPTILQHVGFTIEDIGGTGRFVRAGNENRFYTNTPHVASLSPGTFVYRNSRDFPSVKPDQPGKLWHPVKPED